MLLTPEQAQAIRPDRVALFSDMASLYASLGVPHREPEADLLVLRGALSNAEIDGHFGSPAWPLTLVRSLPLPTDEDWLFNYGGAEASPDVDPGLTPEDITRIERAAGIAGPPSGNVRCTWWIRRYDQNASGRGDLRYLRAVHGRLLPGPSFARALLDRLIELLASASECGGELLVEQLTIIVAKDAAEPLRTLTPLLHADEYYGPRETVISSLCESGWSRYGGALFLPTCRMTDFAEAGPVDMQRLTSGLTKEPVVRPGSGDVLFYDGMKGKDGTTDPSRGVPHISADVAGASSRLVILMRHVPPSH